MSFTSAHPIACSLLGASYPVIDPAHVGSFRCVFWQDITVSNPVKEFSAETEIRLKASSTTRQLLYTTFVAVSMVRHYLFLKNSSLSLSEENEISLKNSVPLCATFLLATSKTVV